MYSSNKKLDPAESNLLLFHLPHNMKDSELYNLFRRFGNIYSTRVMTEKNGKSKGIRNVELSTNELNHLSHLKGMKSSISKKFYQKKSI